jgi:uncharacterized protein (TIGR00369 family)
MTDGKKVVVEFTPQAIHRGFSRAVHGGITATLLDEVGGVACGLRAGAKCATVDLAVTYRRPVLDGVVVRAEGWYVRKSGRFVFGAGQLLDPQGNVLATARLRCIALSEDQIQRFTSHPRSA